MKINTNDVKITFACEALNTEILPHKKWQNLNIVMYVPEKIYKILSRKTTYLYGVWIHGVFYRKFFKKFHNACVVG